MNYAPDIDLKAIALGMPGGGVRTYWEPHCLRCGWCSPEPAPNRHEAQLEAGVHLKTGACLADSGAPDEVPGA